MWTRLLISLFAFPSCMQYKFSRCGRSDSGVYCWRVRCYGRRESWAEKWSSPQWILDACLWTPWCMSINLKALALYKGPLFNERLHCFWRTLSFSPLAKSRRNWAGNWVKRHPLKQSHNTFRHNTESPTPVSRYISNGYYFLPHFSPALKGQDTKFVNSNLKIIMQWRGDLWRHLTIVPNSGSHQSFLTDTAICIVERWTKRMGCRFVPGCSCAQESRACQCLIFFCLICRVTFCWDPETLLPWQRDVTTSPLYFITNHSRQYISPLKLSMFAVCKLVGVEFDWNLTNWG